jgi:hypothetical protein
MFRQIWQGDDHINPQKLLERQYLYRSLLALRMRELMLNMKEKKQETTQTTTDGGGGGATNTTTTNGNRTTASASSSSLDDLYETATSDLLERGKFETTSNVDLRRQLQELLQPQILSIFRAIRNVDESMGIRHGVATSDNDDDGGSSSTVWSLDDGFYRDLLLHEHDTVQQQTMASKMASRRYFFDTKLSALETILHHFNWKDCGNNPLLRSRPSVLDAFGMDLTQHAIASIELIRRHQALNLCRNVLLREKLGYSVISLRSSIAGRGLFMDGRAVTPGTLLAFFPGDVWPKEHLLTNAPDVMDHFAHDDDSHISLRFDDYVIDARQSPVTVLSKPPASCNPYALAHMANHATNSDMINCQSCMVDFGPTMISTKQWTKDDETLLIRYIPNTYARPPTWQSRFFFTGFGQDIIMHGLSLLSLRRNIANQELFYDYRIQSDEPPDWYRAIPDDTLPQVVFFRNDWQQQS